MGRTRRGERNRDLGGRAPPPGARGALCRGVGTSPEGGGRCPPYEDEPVQPRERRPGAARGGGPAKPGGRTPTGSEAVIRVPRRVWPRSLLQDLVEGVGAGIPFL